MKTYLAMTMMLLTLASPASAQFTTFDLGSLTVSSGKDPISSGITGIVEFESDQRHMIEVAVQHEQAWVIYGKKFGRDGATGMIGMSGGHFQGTPWGGPIVKATFPVAKVGGQQVAVGGLVWPGVFAWEPDGRKDDGVENPEALHKVFMGSLRLDLGPLSVSYTVLNYLEDRTNYLPGVGYTYKVNGNYSVTSSVTRDTNDDVWMFYVGVTFVPSKPAAP